MNRHSDPEEGTPVSPTTIRPSWPGDAACGRADPALFDPIIETVPTGTELARARAAAARYCRGCPVLARCNDIADAHADPGLRAGALRFHDADTGGAYVAWPLIPGAPGSTHDRAAVRERRAERRHRYYRNARERLGKPVGAGAAR